MGSWLIELALSADHEPIVITPDDDELADVCRDAGVKVSVLPWVVVGTRPFQLNRAIALSRVIRQEHPDLVVTHYIFPTRFLVRLAGRLSGVPVLTYVGTRQSWNRNPAVRRLQRALMSALHGGAALLRHSQVCCRCSWSRSVFGMSDGYRPRFPPAGDDPSGARIGGRYTVRCVCWVDR